MRNATQSIVKAGKVLDAFTADEPRLTLRRVSRKAGMPVATVHRILTALVATRLLEKDEESATYAIGRHAYLLGNLYLSSQKLDQAAQPVVTALSTLTGESVNVGVLEEGFLVLLMKEESRHSIRFATHVGSIFPVHASSMGKAFLAELDEDELNTLLPEKLTAVTKWTTTSRLVLQDELRETRRTGCAVDLQGVCEGVSCVGAAIRDSEGKPVAALSVAIPDVRIEPSLWKALQVVVPMAARIISARLGYLDSTGPRPTMDGLRARWQQLQQGET